MNTEWKSWQDTRRNISTAKLQLPLCSFYQSAFKTECEDKNSLLKMVYFAAHNIALRHFYIYILLIILVLKLDCNGTNS